MSRHHRPDLRIDELTPPAPSLMVSATGTPGDAPPLPWAKYLLSLIGFPFRQRKVWDEPEASRRGGRRPT